MGEEDKYREVALGMLERFGGTSVAAVGERTAKVCLLTPKPVGDIAHLHRLLDKALASDEDASHRPWFSMAKALAEHRSARHESALRFLDQTRTIASNSGQVAAELIRAMALKGLNQAHEARDTFARAAQRMDKELPEPGAAPLTGPENWMICHILRREAEQLINGAGAAAATGTGRGTK